MTLHALILAAAGALPACGPAADAAFSEGAPADVVLIVNASEPGWSVLRAEIVLEGSAGALLFDTGAGGAGLNQHRPFAAGAGQAALAALPEVADGSRAMALDFAAFPAGARFGFGIDLDATAPGRASTIVDGADLAGARLTVTFAHERGGTETHSGLFDARGAARAAAPCVS